MKFYAKILSTVSASALIFSSCVNGSVAGRSTIPFVENLLADSASVRYSLLSSYMPSSQGSITIIGPAERCFSLSEKFMSFDAFDNIDGSDAPDALPDFAGETIASVYDIANTPYEGYVQNGNTRFLRELSAKNMLMAIQKTCSISPYDHTGEMDKLPAKLVVYASPYYDEYSRFDVDTLFTGKNLQVVVAADPDADSLAVALCYNVMREHNLFTHKVSLPVAKGYITYPASGSPEQSYAQEGVFPDGYKYSRADGSGKDTYVLLGYSERYLSEETLDLLRSKAPLTYSSYVQD